MSAPTHNALPRQRWRSAKKMLNMRRVLAAAETRAKPACFKRHATRDTAAAGNTRDKGTSPGQHPSTPKRPKPRSPNWNPRRCPPIRTERIACPKLGMPLRVAHRQTQAYITHSCLSLPSLWSACGQQITHQCGTNRNLKKEFSCSSRPATAAWRRSYHLCLDARNN